jgi:hypothetical protein
MMAIPRITCGVGPSRFFSTFYLANAALLASYFAVRPWFLAHGDLKFSKLQSIADLHNKVRRRRYVWPRRRRRLPVAAPPPAAALAPGETHLPCFRALQEGHLFALLLISLSYKFARRQSLDAFVAALFFYAKALLALLTWFMDWRLFVYYMLAFLGESTCSVASPPPPPPHPALLQVQLAAWARPFLGGALLPLPWGSLLYPPHPRPPWPPRSSLPARASALVHRPLPR